MSHFWIQIKDLLVRTIDSWVSLFDENNKENLPLLRMELTFDDRKMQFYPQYEELEELALFVVSLICKTLQNVPTVWMFGSLSNVDQHFYSLNWVVSMRKIFLMCLSHRLSILRTKLGVIFPYHYVTTSNWFFLRTLRGAWYSSFEGDIATLRHTWYIDKFFVSGLFMAVRR